MSIKDLCNSQDSRISVPVYGSFFRSSSAPVRNPLFELGQWTLGLIKGMLERRIKVKFYG